MEKGKARIKCKNCGQEFEPTCHITRQKFCSKECRFVYNNAKRHYAGIPQGKSQRRRAGGAPLEGKKRGQTYCSRYCYLLAMDETHIEGKCQWCGRPISTTGGTARSYCSKECAAAGTWICPALGRPFPLDEALAVPFNVLHLASACIPKYIYAAVVCVAPARARPVPGY